MNFKQKREKPCHILGTLSTSSDYTNRPRIVTFKEIHSFTIITVFVFIFSLINILADLKKKKKKKTSTHVSKRLYFYFNYLRKLQSAKPFFTSQKITISKAVLYISRSLHQPFSTSPKITIGQHPVRAKTTRKRKRKGRRRRKRGRKGIMEKAGLKKIPSKRAAPFKYVPWSSSINGQD